MLRRLQLDGKSPSLILILTPVLLVQIVQVIQICACKVTNYYKKWDSWVTWKILNHKSKSLLVPSVLFCFVFSLRNFINTERKTK